MEGGLVPCPTLSTFSLEGRKPTTPKRCHLAGYSVVFYRQLNFWLLGRALRVLCDPIRSP